MSNPNPTSVIELEFVDPNCWGPYEEHFWLWYLSYRQSLDDASTSRYVILK